MGNGLSISLSVSGHSTMLLREGIEVCEREKRKKKKNKMKEIMLYLRQGRMAKWTCLYSFLLVKIYDVGTLGNMGRTFVKVYMEIRTSKYERN